jgi:assimilatory nitrate reductase catalytic subunit
MKQTKSTCCYCGVGCGVIIHSENNVIVDVKGDPDHPANFGRLCTKGATLHLTAKLDNRLLYPEMRSQRAEQRQQASWDESLDFVADKFAQTIQQYGPDSVAFYISGQLLTEDYYVFNKLAKGLIGTNNVDSNSRLCMSSAVAGYKVTLGSDAPPACYEDIDHTNCLLIAGSNTAFAHPIIFRRIEDAKKANPDLKIIVVDPRKTDTAMSADLHLAILPGTDVALFNGMLHVLLWEGLLDNAFIKSSTTGFEVLKDTVREYTPKMVADICGIKESDVVTAAKWFGAGPSLSMYCMGLNQSIHGTDKNAALINLHLATGQIGKPGAGPFSLTGQPNAMGGREVGGMANLMSGHRDLSNAEHRAEVAKLWGVDTVPEKAGKTAVEMFDAVKAEDIKAIWIACTNPAHSMPDLNSVLEALDKAELVVVQDAFNNTSTGKYADVLLPASTWGEKEGSVTNSERRITRVNPAVQAPAEARHDWAIMVDFARRLEKRLGKTSTLFPYETTEAVFNEHRETTRGRDLDITGLSYMLLNE